MSKLWNRLLLLAAWIACMPIPGCQHACKAADGPPSYIHWQANTNPIPTHYTNGIRLADAPFSITTNGIDLFSIVTNAIGLCTNYNFIEIPSGQYYLSATVQTGDAGAAYLNKCFVLRGPTNGTVIINGTNASGPLFYTRTSSVIGYGTKNFITNGATKGSYTFICSTVTGLAVGDVVRVGQTNDPAIGWKYSGSATDEAQSQICRVTNVSGSTIMVNVPLYEDLNNFPFIKELNSTVGGIGYENLILTSTNATQNTQDSLITFWRTTNCWVKNVTGTNYGHVGTVTMECLDPMYENCYFGECFSGESSRYAYQTAGASTRTRYWNCIAGKSSSGFIFQGSTYAWYDGCYAWATGPYPYYTQSGTPQNFLCGGFNGHGFAPRGTIITMSKGNCVFLDDTWGPNLGTTIWGSQLTRIDPALDAAGGTVSNSIKGIEIQYTNRQTFVYNCVIGKPEQLASGRAKGLPTGIPSAGGGADGIATNSANLRLISVYTEEDGVLNTWNSDTYTTPPTHPIWGEVLPPWWPATNVYNVPYPPTIASGTATQRTNWIPAVYRQHGVAYSLVGGGGPPPDPTPTPVCCGDRAL